MLLNIFKYEDVFGSCLEHVGEMSSDELSVVSEGPDFTE